MYNIIKQIQNWTPFMKSACIYILTIMLFSYNKGVVVLSYIAFAIMFVLARKKMDGKIIKNYLYSYMLILTLYWFISVLVSINFTASFIRFITMFLMFLQCIIFFNGLRDNSSEDIFDFFSLTIVLTCIIYFFYDLLSVGVSNYFSYILDGLRLYETTSQANVMGVFASICLIVMLFYIFFKKTYFYIFLLPIPLTMVLASQSKKALLNLFLGFVILFLFKYIKHLISGIVLLFLIVSLIFVFEKTTISEAIVDRFLSFYYTVIAEETTQIDHSSQFRSWMIDDGLEFHKERPLLGYGSDCYRFLSPYETYSHNNYIEILVNNGIIGIIVYYWIYAYLLIALFKRTLSLNKHACLLLSIIMIQCFNDIGQVSYYNKMTYIYLSWIVVYLNKKHIEDADTDLSNKFLNAQLS